MTSLDAMLADLLALITENTRLAGPIIGLLAFAESLIVIGLFRASDRADDSDRRVDRGLDPVPVLVWAVTGSLLGDWLSYLLGRWIGPSIYRRRPLRNHRTGMP